VRCDWEDYDERDDRGWRRVKCKRCGMITGRTPHTFDRIKSECRVPGWGDWLAHFLATWTGITKENTAATLRRFGLIKQAQWCGCQQRQEAVNSLGQWVEMAIAKAVSFFRKREPPSA
jgi:hypothetical protein